VPDTVTKSVVFLCVKTTENGVERYTVGGTAFFIAIQSENDPDIGYSYLVTARHCIEAAKRVGNMYVRANTKDGATYFEVDSYDWLMPPDTEAADVAVTLAIPPGGLVDYLPAPYEMLATDEVIDSYQIGLGDDVIAIGLHASRHGQGRNLPIIRAGVISCIPHLDEPLQDLSSGQDYNAYLVELRSVGGLSGSPVFAMLGEGRLSKTELDGKLYKGFLIGLIRGHFQTDVPVIGYDKIELEKLNEGIAIVTPIQEETRSPRSGPTIRWAGLPSRKVSILEIGVGARRANVWV
jgi:hypothetical protein